MFIFKYAACQLGVCWVVMDTCRYLLVRNTESCSRFRKFLCHEDTSVATWRAPCLQIGTLYTPVAIGELSSRGEGLRGATRPRIRRQGHRQLSTQILFQLSNAILMAFANYC